MTSIDPKMDELDGSALRIRGAPGVPGQKQLIVSTFCLILM